VKGLVECYIFYEMDGTEDEEEIVHVGSELERFNGECETQDGNCEATVTETDDRNIEWSETGKAE
jgi:hypothetical protein